MKLPSHLHRDAHCMAVMQRPRQQCMQQRHELARLRPQLQQYKHCQDDDRHSHLQYSAVQGGTVQGSTGQYSAVHGDTGQCHRAQHELTSPEDAVQYSCEQQQHITLTSQCLDMCTSAAGLTAQQPAVCQRTCFRGIRPPKHQPPHLVAAGVEHVECWQQQLLNCSCVAAEQHQQEQLHMRAYVAVLVAAQQAGPALL